MGKQKRVTVCLSNESWEWLKNYQYSLMVQSNEIISLQEIIENALCEYQQMQSINIISRPDYLVNIEKQRNQRIKKAQLENQSILKMMKDNS